MTCNLRRPVGLRQSVTPPCIHLLYYLKEGFLPEASPLDSNYEASHRRRIVPKWARQYSSDQQNKAMHKTHFPQGTCNKVEYEYQW